MMQKIVWFIFGMVFAFVAGEDCRLPQGSSILFENVVSSYEFTLPDKTNLSSYELSVVYTWDIKEGTDFDGILYKIADRDEGNDELSIAPGGGISSYNKCLGLTNKIWAVNGSGNPVECNLPCTEYLSKQCLFSTLCTSLKKDFKSLSKDERKIKFPLKLGASYDLELKLYKGWFTFSDRKFLGQPVFCKHELIMGHDVHPDDAHDFCKDEQSIEDKSYPSGPPASLGDCQLERNLNNNKANCVFRWKDPHDVAENAELTGFGIHIQGGEVDETVMKASSGKIGEDGYRYYSVKVKNIQFGEENFIKITPFVENKNCESTVCSRDGFPVKKSYLIPEFDACTGDNITGRYCDSNANCTDMPGTNDTAAICACGAGFIGNGINNIWETGTGCLDYDSCSENSTYDDCDPNAFCTDSLPPNYNVTCACPTGFIGDGYRSGSGCTKLSLVVALGVCIPLAILMVMLIVLFVWRSRAIKRRKIEMKMSKFFSTQDPAYVSPLKDVLKNGDAADHEGASDGVFGDKWELDRATIELKGVMGRGNFGVVQKAVLNIDGDERAVAVKMTAEGCSESVKAAFLAEISIITSLGAHEHLIGMIGCCTTGENPIYLVSEFMEYGDLQHFLWDAREESNRARDNIYNLTEYQIYKIGSQVANGMKYLTDIKVIHGDLAARNILVGEGLKCKISDFGLANDVYRYGMIKNATEKTVPLKWVSPERMMAGKIPITWRSDVWSFGILLYEAVTLGSSPYPGIEREELFNKLESGYRMAQPASCSKHLYDVMMRCWEWSPSKRPSFVNLEEDMQASTSNQNHDYVNLVTMVPSLDCQSNDTEQSSLLQSRVPRQQLDSTTASNGVANRNNSNSTSATADNMAFQPEASTGNECNLENENTVSAV